MTPQEKVEQLISLKIAEWAGKSVENLTDDDGETYRQDATNDVRCGEVETGLPAEYSRNYESKSVAAKAPDGSWVGWTYWYGGGKHAESEAIDWIDDAYDLDCVEGEKMVVVRTFSKVPKKDE